MDRMSLLEQETRLRKRELGQPGQRLTRGLLWATVAIFVISVLAFLAGQAMILPVFHRY